MSKLKIAAVDPALRHTGIARAIYNTETCEFENLTVTLFCTTKGNQLHEIRNCYALATRFRSLGMTFQYVCVEVPGGSQSASAAKGIGCVLALFTQIPQCRLVPVTPTEVKVAAVNNRKAGKREIIEWAAARYPEAGWHYHKYRGEMRLTNDNEHMADAIAILYAGVANGLKTLGQ